MILGVIFVDLLVNLFNSRFPDLTISVVIILLVFLDGIEIVRDARRERVNLLVVREGDRNYQKTMLINLITQFFGIHHDYI